MHIGAADALGPNVRVQARMAEEQVVRRGDGKAKSFTA
jgi:hypothetical protein